MEIEKIMPFEGRQFMKPLNIFLKKNAEQLNSEFRSGNLVIIVKHFKILKIICYTYFFKTLLCHRL
jgi:hypothetical protein